MLWKTKESRAGLKSKAILRPISKDSSHRLCHEDPVFFTDAQRAQRLCPKGNCSERFPLHGSASLSAVLDLFSQQTTLLRMVFLNTLCFPPALAPLSLFSDLLSLAQSRLSSPGAMLLMGIGVVTCKCRVPREPEVQATGAQ